MIADCRLLVSRFASLATYLVVNISSPNTARLRELQGKGALRELLTEVRAAIPSDRPKPLFVKIAPDLSDAEISDVVAVVLEVGLSGVVATNTTIARRRDVAQPAQIGNRRTERRSPSCPITRGDQPDRC